METVLDLTWQQLSQYSDFDVALYVPPAPGVYRIGYFDPRDGGRYVFHVGQADDLEGQLQQHLRVSEPNPCIRQHVKRPECYVVWAIIEDRARRDAAEKALTEKYFGHHELNLAVTKINRS